MPDYQLALDEARRGADQQAGVLAQLRSNTMALLAVSVTITSYLATLAVTDDHGWSPLLVLAAVLAAVHVTLALSVVWPHHLWTTTDPIELVTWAEVDHMDTQNQQRDLALHMAANYEDNARTLSSMTTRYCLAVATLVIVVTAFAAHLTN